MSGMAVTLRWSGEALRFEGGSESGPRAVIDGNGKDGVSPMQALLLSLAGCMAIDVVEILGKMRAPFDALEVRVEGERAPEPPRRFTRIQLVYLIDGLAPADEEKARRAIALSEEKYCSVLHTLRPDLDFSTAAVFG